MKKLIILIIILFAFSVYAECELGDCTTDEYLPYTGQDYDNYLAWGSQTVGIVGGSGAACTQQDSEEAHNNINSFASTTSNDWIGQKFTTSAAYSLSKIDICMYKQASPTGNITAKIYNNDGASPTDPDDQRGSDSTAVDASTVTTENDCSVYTTFTFPTPVSLENGGTYWWVITKDSTDGTNYLRVRHLYNGADDPCADCYAIDADGLGNWTNVDYFGRWITYSGGCN